MRTEFIIIAVVIFILGYLMRRYYNKYKHYQALYFSQKEQYKELVSENFAEIKLCEEYISFFKTYCNEDWNRDTPFLKKIEALQIFFSHSRRDKTIYPLSTLCKDIPISEEASEQLKSVFQEDYNTILEMPLGKVLMFSADLKSYREGSSENEDLTPQEFYKWRMEC